jgi:NAD+ kinase
MERHPIDGPIGLVVHPERKIDNALSAIHEWAERRGLRVGQVAVDGQNRRVADPIEPAECALIVAVGGDGTALAALHSGADVDSPVLGVACGSIGALTSVTADKVESALERVAEGDWRVHSLPALHVSDGNDSWVAINDLAVVRDGDGQLVTGILVDGEIYARVAGDGVIVATPIGSSAYTMAARGPLLTPTCENFVVTPIAAHGGSIPPLVLSGGNELGLELEPGFGGMRLEVDGRGKGSCAPKLTVELRKDYSTLVALDGGEAMIAGLRRRGLVLDSPRAKLREERSKQA